MAVLVSAMLLGVAVLMVAVVSYLAGAISTALYLGRREADDMMNDQLEYVLTIAAREASAELRKTSDVVADTQFGKKPD